LARGWREEVRYFGKGWEEGGREEVIRVKRTGYMNA